MTPASSPRLKTEPFLGCSVRWRVRFYAGIFHWVTQGLCSSFTENGAEFPIFWGFLHNHTMTLATRLQISAPFSRDVPPFPNHFMSNQIFCFMWTAWVKIPRTIWGRRKMILSHLYFYLYQGKLLVAFSGSSIESSVRTLWGHQAVRAAAFKSEV